ncbi:hypothetical protein C8Q72DRAFT_446570 [Fomitopsis betulina]|nr:hypothetical protein C8Q72DRAFT_446570 [Fomitopsis betulina]
MHTILHEVVDRSFVLGIVLAHTNLSVYLADWTGVLGSNRFDIHEDAHALVWVVVGICTMSPVQLGWDTSMSVIKEEEQYTTTFLREWTRSSPTRFLSIRRRRATTGCLRCRSRRAKGNME